MKTLDEALMTMCCTIGDEKQEEVNLDNAQRFGDLHVEVVSNPLVRRITEVILTTCAARQDYDFVQAAVLNAFANGVRIGIEMERADP